MKRNNNNIKPANNNNNNNVNRSPAYSNLIEKIKEIAKIYESLLNLQGEIKGDNSTGIYDKINELDAKLNQLLQENEWDAFLAPCNQSDPLVISTVTSFFASAGATSLEISLATVIALQKIKTEGNNNNIQKDYFAKIRTSVNEAPRDNLKKVGISSKSSQFFVELSNVLDYVELLVVNTDSIQDSENFTGNNLQKILLILAKLHHFRNEYSDELRVINLSRNHSIYNQIIFTLHSLDFEAMVALVEMCCDANKKPIGQELSQNKKSSSYTVTPPLLNNEEQTAYYELDKMIRYLNIFCEKSYDVLSLVKSINNDFTTDYFNEARNNRDIALFDFHELFTRYLKSPTWVENFGFTKDIEHNNVDMNRRAGHILNDSSSQASLSPQEIMSMRMQRSQMAQEKSKKTNCFQQYLQSLPSNDQNTVNNLLSLINSPPNSNQVGEINFIDNAKGYLCGWESILSHKNKPSKLTQIIKTAKERLNDCGVTKNTQIACEIAAQYFVIKKTFTDILNENINSDEITNDTTALLIKKLEGILIKTIYCSQPQKVEKLIQTPPVSITPDAFLQELKKKQGQKQNQPIVVNTKQGKQANDNTLLSRSFEDLHQEYNPSNVLDSSEIAPSSRVVLNKPQHRPLPKPPPTFTFSSEAELLFSMQSHAPNQSTPVSSLLPQTPVHNNNNNSNRVLPKTPPAPNLITENKNRSSNAPVPPLKPAQPAQVPNNNNAVQNRREDKQNNSIANKVNFFNNAGTIKSLRNPLILDNKLVN